MKFDERQRLTDKAMRAVDASVETAYHEGYRVGKKDQEELQKILSNELEKIAVRLARAEMVSAIYDDLESEKRLRRPALRVKLERARNELQKISNELLEFEGSVETGWEFTKNGNPRLSDYYLAVVPVWYQDGKWFANSYRTVEYKEPPLRYKRMPRT